VVHFAYTDPDLDPADQGGKILQLFFPGKFHSLMSQEAAVTEILVTSDTTPVPRT
jgi:hypothetical protein